MSTEKLSKILERMDIPVQRKYTMNKSNLVWLEKHLADRNAEKRDFAEAMREIEYRLVHKVYEN